MTVDVQFGLKLWSTDAALLPGAVDLIREGAFHYLEIVPVPGTPMEPFAAAGLPSVIHAASEQHGVNIADPARKDLSRRLVDRCLAWADRLGSPQVILHPGFGDPAVAARFLARLGDRRIVIENMPKVGLFGEPMVGYDRTGLVPLLGACSGFCLDLNHAVKAAVSLRVDYRAFTRDLMGLSPVLFHISDGTLATERDEHLSIGDGEYDFTFLTRCIARRPGARVTLGTPRPSGTLRDDLANRGRLIGFLEDLA